MPETHDRQNGTLVSIPSIVDEIISKREQHDGITILGGEPFDQTGQVAELISRLKRHNLHITICSALYDRIADCPKRSKHRIRSHSYRLDDRWAIHLSGTRECRRISRFEEPTGSLQTDMKLNCEYPKRILPVEELAGIVSAPSWLKIKPRWSENVSRSAKSIPRLLIIKLAYPLLL
ncbi:MAG: 4Fe-4S cluster-binding domain-containing protein [Chloracidobacterium sp.]|nr:4Fe-4S cluster-binding domain-containing protein [Chloracidobacterium sp.]